MLIFERNETIRTFKWHYRDSIEARSLLIVSVAPKPEIDVESTARAASFDRITNRARSPRIPFSAVHLARCEGITIVARVPDFPD